MGDLKLIEAKIRKEGKAIFDRYLCFCGKEFIARRNNVNRGETKSCGCIRKKMVIDKNTKHGLRNENHRLYVIWKGMRERCNNPNCDHYKYYGAKGVIICAEWNDYKTFYEWAIKNGYKDDLTIDRIDPFGNYEPLNCRWATHLFQAQNKRDTLGWAAVNEIRECYNKGEFVKSLSERFQVCRSAIKRILNNETYHDPNFYRARKGRVYSKKQAA